MTDLTYRAVPIREANSDGRTMDILVAPTADVADLGFFRERYAQGALEPADRVALKLETGLGHAGPVIGRAVHFEETPDGLVGTFRVSDTEAGRDALILAADGALGASAGFLETTRTVNSDGTEVVEGGSLREVTLTGTPAYVTAGPLDIRSHTKGLDVEDTTSATDTVATTEDDRDAVADAVNRALDEYRQGVAEMATPPAIAAEHRGHQYRSFGELLADTVAHARRSDSEATERLTRSIDLGGVKADGSAIELSVRAFGTPATTAAGADGIVPNTYVPEMLELLREGRPTADLFNKRGLPMRGTGVDLPLITSGATVGYQATQGVEVSNTNLDTDTATFPKSTMAGGQGYSLQAAQWSDPGYADEVVRDLLAAYAEFLDGQTIIGDGATPNATAYTGILEGATDVPIGGTGIVTDALAVLGTAAAAVYAGSRRMPKAWIMNSAAWGAFINAVDTDGRPIVSNTAPMNPAGLMDVSAIGGYLRGLPIVVDENVPADAGVGTDESPIILGSFRDAILFEDQGAPAQIGLSYPDVLTTDVTVYGFSALAIRRPAAFAVVSGLVTG